jgi:hypothetical protein
MPEGLKVVEYGGLTTDLKLGNLRRTANPILNEIQALQPSYAKTDKDTLNKTHQEFMNKFEMVS